MTKVDVYIGAGSNVEPEHHLRLACQALRERFGPLRISSVYRNPPVGFEGEPFLNLVIGFHTSDSAAAIVEELERLHSSAGRMRSSNPFGPRSLDLDLLLYGEQIIDSPPIRVPRSDIEEYSFVLGPLAEIAPDLRHPIDGRTMAELWASFDQSNHPLERTDIEIEN